MSDIVEEIMNYDLDHPMWGLDDDKKKQILGEVCNWVHF